MALVHKVHILHRSHPVWDEWIEIAYNSIPAISIRMSHPVWDEWIEILSPRSCAALCLVSSRLG